jgi:hypothetical protein
MGTGQFRPGDAANPHIGSVGKLEEVEEARVETLCVGYGAVKSAVEALRGKFQTWSVMLRCLLIDAFSAHPYEVPAYEVYKLEVSTPIASISFFRDAPDGRRDRGMSFGSMQAMNDK